jgi:hypothetical protein
MTIADEVDSQLRQAMECYVEESIIDSLPDQILLAHLRRGQGVN